MDVDHIMEDKSRYNKYPGFFLQKAYSHIKMELLEIHDQKLQTKPSFFKDSWDMLLKLHNIKEETVSEIWKCLEQSENKHVQQYTVWVQLTLKETLCHPIPPSEINTEHQYYMSG